MWDNVVLGQHCLLRWRGHSANFYLYSAHVAAVYDHLGWSNRQAWAGLQTGHLQSLPALPFQMSLMAALPSDRRSLCAQGRTWQLHWHLPNKFRHPYVEITQHCFKEHFASFAEGLTECLAVHLQLFNELNARKIQDELNMFSGVLKSHVFLYVFAIVVGLQVTSSGMLCSACLEKVHGFCTFNVTGPTLWWMTELCS